jgi:hypothetical protein
MCIKEFTLSIWNFYEDLHWFFGAVCDYVYGMNSTEIEKYFAHWKIPTVPEILWSHSV